MSDAIGVDACKGGWVAVTTRQGRFVRAEFAESFHSVVSAAGEDSTIAVDIPIGLPERGRRDADVLAKKRLSTTASSVFFVPCEPVLSATTYQEARRIAKRLGEPGVSAQSYALRAKVFEVAPLAASDERIFEVHPEVSFRELAGRALAPKKTWNGFHQRLELLQRVGIVVHESGSAGVKAACDDVLDAAVAAWTARRIQEGRALCIPDREVLMKEPRIWC